MKIVVSAQGDTLDSPASPVFGRCPVLAFVDTETMALEAVANPAQSLGGGAGIQAAQFVVNRGAQAVLSGNLGPNALAVFRAAGIPYYQISGGTVRQAVETYLAGQLLPMGGATAAAHTGLRGGGGWGMGAGRGAGRRGMAFAPPPAEAGATREAELSELRQTVEGLRRQLSEAMDRIDSLQKKEE